MRKRQAKQRQAPHRRSRYTSYVAWCAIIILAVLVVRANIVPEDPNLQQCPRQISGAEDYTLRIDYFDSPYCIYCHLQKGPLLRMTTAFNESIQLRMFDIRYCSQDAMMHGISGTPGFVFQIGNATKVHMGMIDEEHLQQIGCDVSEKC